MVDREKGMKKNESWVFLGMALFVIMIGIFSFLILQKLSVHNKHICSYLGGIWERKIIDSEYRCYTYDELYM